MDFNWTGVAAALAAFSGVWSGHVLVRRWEAQAADIRLPMAFLVFLGLLFEAGALSAQNSALSAALGILGITFLWDALEFIRQQKRVKIGHAPANPQNPRHARILAEYPAATTRNLLDREPAGRKAQL